jgi:hypothetical protein
LSVEARKPFLKWSRSIRDSELCTFVKDVRTLAEAHNPDFIKFRDHMSTLAAHDSLASEKHWFGTLWGETTKTD